MKFLKSQQIGKMWNAFPLTTELLVLKWLLKLMMQLCFAICNTANPNILSWKLVELRNVCSVLYWHCFKDSSSKSSLNSQTSIVLALFEGEPKVLFSWPKLYWHLILWLMWITKKKKKNLSGDTDRESLPLTSNSETLHVQVWDGWVCDGGQRKSAGHRA